jgi:hypothetical protein
LSSAATALSLEIEPDKPSTPSSTFGIDPSFLKLYEEHYHPINVQRTEGAHLFAPGAVLSSEQTCPNEVLLPTEYYNDFLRPQKLRHVLGAFVHIGSQQMSLLSVYPSPHSDSLSDVSRYLLGVLVPHMQRVNRMAAQRATAQNRNSIPEPLARGGNRGERERQGSAHE